MFSHNKLEIRQMELVLVSFKKLMLEIIKAYYESTTRLQQNNKLFVHKNSRDFHSLFDV